MVHDSGARIIACGRRGNGFETVFMYAHDDLRVEFKAMRRPGKDWVDYSLAGKREYNFALGPECSVCVFARYAYSWPRTPSDEEVVIIKKNIAEFLTNEFYKCGLAVAPYPQTISFYGGV
jgi:hypothetical protein